jgi:hypothetical protein
MANEPKYGHADGLPVHARTRHGGIKDVLDAIERLDAARSS